MQKKEKKWALNCMQSSDPLQNNMQAKCEVKYMKNCKNNTPCLIFVQTVYLFMIIFLSRKIWIIHKTCTRLSAESPQVGVRFRSSGLKPFWVFVFLFFLLLIPFTVVDMKVTAQTRVCQTGQRTKCRFQIEKGSDNTSHTAFEPQR